MGYKNKMKINEDYNGKITIKSISIPNPKKKVEKEVLRKKKLSGVLLLFIITLSSILIMSLFLFYSSDIIKSLKQFGWMWILALLILIRIGTTLGMTIYAFHQWFKQDKLDNFAIPLLFGIFFLFLTIGKTIDLLFKLSYFYVSTEERLNLLKIRYVLVILMMAPLYLLGIKIFFPSLYQNKSLNINKKTTIRTIIFLLAVAKSYLILIAPDIIFFNIIFIILFIPILLWVIISFFYAHIKKLLPQTNPLLLAILFLIDLILFTISRVPFLFNQAAEVTVMSVIIDELVDFTLIILIFIGFSKNNKKLNQN